MGAIAAVDSNTMTAQFFDSGGNQPSQHMADAGNLVARAQGLPQQSPTAEGAALWTQQALDIADSAASALADGRVSTQEALEINGDITRLLINPEFAAAERANPELKQLADGLRAVRATFDQVIADRTGMPHAGVGPQGRAPTTPPTPDSASPTPRIPSRPSIPDLPPLPQMPSLPEATSTERTIDPVIIEDRGPACGGGSC